MRLPTPRLLFGLLLPSSLTLARSTVESPPPSTSTVTLHYAALSANPSSSPTPLAVLALTTTSNPDKDNATLTSYTPPDLPASPHQLLRLGLWSPDHGWERSVLTSAASLGCADEGQAACRKRVTLVVADDAVTEGVQAPAEVVGLRFGAEKTEGPGGVEVRVERRERGPRPLLNAATVPLPRGPDGNVVEEGEGEKKTFLQKYWWIIALVLLLQVAGGGGREEEK